MPFGRHATLIVWFVGIGAVVGLIVWSGADAVGKAVIASGWATAVVLLARAVAVAFAGWGWWLLFPVPLRPSIAACTWFRFVREGTNALLPLAQIGGDFIGARCLALRGTKGTVAAASVIVDVVMQAATQLVFAIVGLVLLVSLGGNELVAWPIALGVAIAMPALGAFVALHGERGQWLFKKFLGFVAGEREWLAFGAIDELFGRLREFYANRGGLIRSFVWHLANWFVGAVEVWVVLDFMGHHVSFEQAVIVESLMHAVRGAAFAVPGALGAQEGGLIVLCAIFGVPAEAALALSLVKRIPDLVIGVPAILAWQAMEGWHFHNRARPHGSGNEQA
jgi:putative membrane protein